ncbi:MAG: fibro-slime domain-containing protein [Candidatus Spyradocola sp.]|nr:fibro-slime domain-containing protein [Candidatus Spyradocola sp.]
MTQKKVLALLLTLCLVFSMTVPAYAASSRSSSWPWTSSSAAAKEEPASTSSGSLVLVEDESTVTEGTELRASTYVLTNDGSASSASADVYIEVDTSMTASELAKAAEEGETFYYLSNGVYYEVTIAKSTIGSFIKRTIYTLTANNVRIATLYGTSKLSSARVTLYTKEAAVSAAALTADATGYVLNDSGASTYAGEPDSTTTLKYFPVTLYNYNTTTINNATHQAEVDNGLGSTWNGIYFNNGNPSAESYTYSTGGEVSYTRTTVDYSNNNNYNKYINNGYYVDVDGTKYLVTGLSCKRSGHWLVGYTYSWTISYAGGTATPSGSSITLYKASTGSTATTASLSYAAWNFWTGHLGGNTESNSPTTITGANGNYLYSGLVESTLTANKDITFTKPDGGIFNSDATVKDIYTGVEMPFVYENGTYTFDASQNGVYFHVDNTQGSTEAQSNGRLYFNEKNTQWNNYQYGKYGDGSQTVWLPFNDATSISGESNCDYHFGMRTTIPFTMTANGKMNPNDETSEDITFSFSGDDDVWVFIDGQLVIDLGGIHNRLDATIDFAANTVTYAENNDATGEMGDAAGVLNVTATQTLFGGLISQDRTTFAATDSHELTIFYLERGAGSSNCKIQFNLPMKDVVSVTKRATQSISSDGALSPLTAQEQETVNNIDFGFTLTKNGTSVANTNYSLLNANGQVIGTPSTDANGHFTLRNGQTAKFVGEIAAEGAEYQVVEDAVEGIGFELPTYTYNGTAAGGFTVSDTPYNKGSDIPATQKNLTSAAVTARGSTDAEDSLQFICENYFDATLPNPSSRPVDDQIVIDYGLPVIIDALANDVYRGDTIELTDVTGAQYGTATIENGKITYQLTKQLTGVEVLTYTAKVTGSGNSGNETTTASESKQANIYIIPATSMYYEENFSGLVTFSDGWSDVGSAQTDPQEPGVVGTVGDSPYGSDAAYLNDSGDSNGSSKFVNTASGSATFSYTFTGTGTSFFARTSGSTAVINIKVTNESGQVAYQNRNTIYTSVDGTDVGTLYNIPVYTNDGLNYGTYTVTVTVLKAVSALNYGAEFYLDGIRVINPLNSTDANASVANAAYATDGEANMAVVTLRQKLIGEAQINGDNTISWNEGDNFVLFTDTNGEIKTADEYKSNGPKEEVYLNNGQSVTFSLTNWDANTNKIYLGIKAPVGSGTVSINGNTLNINNATDCYYDISGYANITTDEDGVKTATFEIKATSSLISVTNIKVTGNAEFIIVNQEDKDFNGSEGGKEDVNSGEGEDQEITDGGAE